ncbi:hypothetical protein SAMN02745229_03907 [Butyrivibrio fibrisolvens DSM 3071]|uniref:Uncharacterized protein n=1 Tax=Butyrivibrio fibrisolvens DSM 3071 TaxID=1121131 RepID=A0A1M6FGN7_BUTFI|nr:hypothetical protein [Butyrivibrio fibrisolvens]SHI96762.1 hypothetical protein SAMN02745229_03907 [Butyrivibrio fibrisolvens DSM 3071]
MANKFKELMRESAATEAESLFAAKAQKPAAKTPVKKESAKKVPEEENISKEEPVKKKNPGGRPKNADRGLACRKQYTLTLEEDTYQTFLEKAREEKISFAKFMEKAAYEYIENNK